MNKYLCIIYIYFSTSIGTFGVAKTPSVEQISVARDIIYQCEYIVNTLSDQRSLLEKKALPVLDRKNQKIIKKIDLAIFDEHIQEFRQFIRDNSKIMTADTEEKMAEQSRTLSNNCKSFALGIEKFLAFSLGRPVSKDFIYIFKLKRKDTMLKLIDEEKPEFINELKTLKTILKIGNQLLFV